MSFEAVRVISADHPSLAGHFPSAPAVPGVVILDEVASALAEWRGVAHLAGIPAVKFLLPLQPGQPFTVRLNRASDNPGRVDFRCDVEGRTVAEGRFEIDLETSRDA